MPKKTNFPKLPSAGVRKYALQHMRVTLGDGEDDVSIEEHPGQTQFCSCGVVYAVFAATDTEIVVDFRSPNELGDLSEKLSHYQKLRHPPGWLRYREPISRDPRPGLESKFGRMIGSTQRELLQGARSSEDVPAGGDAPVQRVPGVDEESSTEPEASLATIISAGGPYLVLAAKTAAKWRGYADQEAYEALGFGADEGRVVDTPAGRAILLGTPDTLFFLPQPDGGVLVRVVSSDDPIEDIPPKLGALDAEGWELLADDFRVTGPLLAIDAATSGEDASDGLQVELSNGTYHVESATSTPDDVTELLLVRLRRAAAPKKKASRKK